MRKNAVADAATTKGAAKTAMTTSSPPTIVLEVERLIAAYSDRFDELCKENGEVPEEALTYKPRTPIEQVAFDIFTDALHDSLMDEDDE